MLYFVADSGANIKNAFEKFNDKHFPCSAHKINSCVEDIFKTKSIKRYVNSKGIFISFFLIKSFKTNYFV